MSSAQRFQHYSGSGHKSKHNSEQEFKCLQCQQFVTCNPLIAGVQNRNHCPACLWSRHLDWRTPGDRLSGCRAAMQPIGLTTKRSRNKYARERDGELMLVHWCTGCAAIVINRIAADDSSLAILEILTRPLPDDTELASALACGNIAVLTFQDRELVQRRLFGDSLLHSRSQAAQNDQPQPLADSYVQQSLNEWAAWSPLAAAPG